MEVENKEMEKSEDTNTKEIVHVTNEEVIINKSVENNEMQTIVNSDNKELAANKETKSPINIENVEILTTKTTAVITSAAESNSLGLLAQYESDENEEEVENKAATEEKISDTESVIEIVNTNEYRRPPVQIELSSDTDSSSDSSTSNERLHRLRKKIDKKILVGSDDDEDDIDEDGDDEHKSRKTRQPPKVKGELLLEELPPIKDLHITVPEEECTELGQVTSIVDQLLLVTAYKQALLVDLDTVLFLDKGKRVLGEVFDVLGQVSSPIYCVRFNSNAHIKDKAISIGDVVYVAPKTEYTQYIILSSLMKNRGSDASWENDIEPPARYIDYSDDEEERKARARLRNKDRHEPLENDAQEKRNCGTINEEDATVASSTSPSVRGNRRRTRGARAAQRGRPLNAAYMQYAAPPPPQQMPADGWHTQIPYMLPQQQQPTMNYHFPQYCPPMYGAYMPHPTMTWPAQPRQPQTQPEQPPPPGK